MIQRIKASLAVAGLAAIAIAAASSQASAFGLRIPQVPVLGGTLQGYLNSKGETFNVLTDQQNAQVWSSSASGNSLLTLMVELTGSAASNELGIYNAGVAAPALYPVFPGAAATGWHAVMSFHAGPARVVVTLFDNLSIIQGQTTYLGADAYNFGFYLRNPANGGTVLYSQDGRNPATAAQMLAYQGTGINAGEWWLCFEDLILAGSDQDYDDAVMILESVNPLATKAATLGAVKALYR
jgi:hypothetical protein